MTGDFVLTEREIRAKVIELFDMCNAIRMNLWFTSGVDAGVLDPRIVGQVMIEELPLRSQQVQRYWATERTDPRS